MSTTLALPSIPPADLENTSKEILIEGQVGNREDGYKPHALTPLAIVRAAFAHLTQEEKLELVGIRLSGGGDYLHFDLGTFTRRVTALE